MVATRRTAAAATQRCLVTGGAGFLGRHLVERLLDAGGWQARGSLQWTPAAPQSRDVHPAAKWLALAHPRLASSAAFATVAAAANVACTLHCLQRILHASSGPRAGAGDGV